MSVKLRWPATEYDKDAKLMCRLFGHVWSSGWWGDMPYLKKSKNFTTDNIGRTHFTLECECDRCYTKSTVARIHGDKNVIQPAA